MKKAFLQIVALLIFANTTLMWSLLNPSLPEGYSAGTAEIYYSPYWRQDGLLIYLGDKSLFSRDGSVGMYVRLNEGDEVNVHYKTNDSRSIILDAYIIDADQIPFTIDKIILEFFASLFLLGILTKRNREKRIY